MFPLLGCPGTDGSLTKDTFLTLHGVPPVLFPDETGFGGILIGRSRSFHLLVSGLPADARRKGGFERLLRFRMGILFLIHQHGVLGGGVSVAPHVSPSDEAKSQYKHGEDLKLTHHSPPCPIRP